MSKTAQKITQATTANTTARKPKTKTVEAVQTPLPAAPQSKQAIILDLLKHPHGATVEELMQATGWQRHSVHGTLSGVVKKRLRLPLARTQEPRGLVYRLAK